MTNPLPGPGRFERGVRQVAGVGFPAGFAAAAPFLGQLIAMLPLMAFGPAVYDRGYHIFEAANAGQVGIALAPVWLGLELILLRWRGSTPSRRVALILAVAAGLAMVPATVLLTSFPLGFRWGWWGLGLALGLAAARGLAPRGLVAWMVLPAVTTFLAHHIWHLVALVEPGWSVVVIVPALAGAVAGLVVRGGLQQGRRWGPVPSEE